MSSKPMLVALTGGIGCGKTTVLNAFRSLGIPCFVADEVAGAYYNDPAFLEQVRTLLGPSVIAPDGSANKQAIAAIVFNNPEALKQLNALIHPRVWQDFLSFANLHQSAPYVIFESAITYEYGFDRLVDKVICVYLEQEERLRRLELRDHATRDQLLSRMRNQLPAEEKMMRSPASGQAGPPEPDSVHRIVIAQYANSNSKRAYFSYRRK